MTSRRASGDSSDIRIPRINKNDRARKRVRSRSQPGGMMQYRSDRAPNSLMPTHRRSRPAVRVKAPLASGLEAWAYVDSHGKPPLA
jgi:hypothetical protein